MRRVYISGPMTGLPELNHPAFQRAAALLRGLGYQAVNPAELGVGSADWHECMRRDIRALCDCDALALLPGWERSQGAHIELHLAHRLQIDIGFLDLYTDGGSVRWGSGLLQQGAL